MRLKAMLCAALVLALLGLAAASAGAATTRLTVRGSVEQVDVTGAPKGARLVLLAGRHRHTVAVVHASSLGAAIFRQVSPGSGYRIRVPGGAESSAVTVLPDRSAPPSTSIYKQRIPASGYGYLSVRDGTKLAIDIHLPGGKGPFPTLIEYAGYGYADPKGPQSGIAAIANALGFAVVDVNMRGTGCSGGGFDYFEPLQSLDGYDVIETVAHQAWVLHHKVGMMGISYGGISQLFVAATNPPDLAAISPLSVIDNTATTLYPGGILNTGFALAWAMERVHDAQPASATGGQPWALAQIKAGDRICKANQTLHSAAVNLIAKVFANRYYVPSVADPLAPITFVDKIRAPVYLACQLTDEQTGAHCPALAEHFTGTSHKWFTFTNGLHIDSLDPATFTRWYDFLELYVARRAPHLSSAQRGLASVIYNAAMGISGMTLPADPIQAEPSYAAALDAFDQIPRIRILFDNGIGTGRPNVPGAGFEHAFSRFPLPGTQAASWYLGTGETLAATKPAGTGHDSFTWNKHARALTDFTGNTGGGGLWGDSPNYHWVHNPAGTAVSYTTAALASNTVVVGAGALQAWIRASTLDVDLQVTLSEVRPDGKETFVQNGWLRASDRKLDAAKSTLLEPVLSLRHSDAAPLPAGRYTEVTVPLYYEAHAYRAGSRIRVTISAPNGDQPVWSFGNTTPAGKAAVSIGFSPLMPSRLVLPVIPGLSVPTPLPPCPSLRGEPCRAKT